MASSGVTVEVKGLQELALGLVLLADEIGQAAGQAFDDVASTTAAVVAARVPRESGRLASSVETAYDRARQAASVGMGDGVPYAGWIEFGGGRYGASRPYMPGGRYLWPAVDAASRELETVGSQAAKSEIRRFPWRRPTVL